VAISEERHRQKVSEEVGNVELTWESDWGRIGDRSWSKFRAFCGESK
jgi:hypothetical protein